MTRNLFCIIWQSFVTLEGTLTTSGAGTFSPTCSPHNRAMSVKSRRILALTYAVADKQLNLKPDGGHSFLVWAFIPVKKYIPAKAISQQVLGYLKNGDYVGVYSPLDG